MLVRLGRMRLVPAIALLALLVATTARARADDGVPKKYDKPEFDAFPLLGGDSDIGFGGGGLAAVTQLDPRQKPYVWRAEVGLLATFKPENAGRPWRVPYQDYYVLLTVPHLLDDRMRLEVRPSFTYETTQRYYGIGNQSRDTSPAGPADPGDPYYEYGRTHPTLVVRARLKVAEHCFLRVGNSYTQNWLDVKPRSRISEDRASADPYVRRILADVGAHAVDFFEYGVEYDRRDDEIETTTGTWDQLKLRLSPGGGGDLDHRYAQLDAIARVYVPVGSRVVIAARAVGDVQWGDPPFYELARYEDTFALGGSMGVRGVPGQRYYGAAKVFGNLEVRAFFWDFRALDKPFSLGAVGFLDGGRVWSELFHVHSDLDGTTLGLKFGAGGGIRLRQGEAFVVRGDLAWSPDARPIGGYFAAGELF